MAKNLVIVESPAKAKTIEGFLGKEYTVKSSYGHVRDLNKNTLSVNIEKDFEPEYEISDDKKALVAELRKLSKASDTVWLASDEDREGESISWHLYEALDLKKKDTKRIVFHEITKSAILNAIENPRRGRPTSPPRARPPRGLRTLAPALEEGKTLIVSRSCAVGGRAPHRGTRGGNQEFRANECLSRDGAIHFYEGWTGIHHRRRIAQSL